MEVQSMSKLGQRNLASSLWRAALVLTLVLAASGLAACGAAATPTPVKAVAWPEKDVTFIVPFNPGGGFDLTARMVAPFIEKYAAKKVNVVIKNVPGASGKIGLQEVLDAKADGHTIGVFDPVQLGTLQALGDLGQTDMSKMGWLGQLDWGAGLVAIGQGKFKDIQSMKGQEVRFAVTGQAGFSAVMVGKALGATPRVIVYNSSVEANTACMRGDADATVFTWPSLWKQVNASEGKLIPAFLAADKRDSHMPNVPSSKELGLTLDGSVLGAAHIVAGPPGMSKELQDLMIGVLKKAMADPEFIAQMEKAGYPVVPLFDKELTDTVNGVAKVMEQNKDVLKSLAQ